MALEKDEIIKQLALEGKDKADVRRALISEGLSTEGFETVYEKFAKDVPVKKPKQVTSEGRIVGDFESFQIDATPRKRTGPSFLKFILFGALIVCAIVGYSLATKGSFFTPSGEITVGGTTITNDIQNFNFGDKLMQGKVESAAASAYVFKRTMASFEGVCRDIIVVAPVECIQTNESFVIFAPISNNQYYCVDAAGSRKTLENKPLSSASCQ